MRDFFVNLLMAIRSFFICLYEDVRQVIVSEYEFWRLKHQKSANTADLPSARMTLSPVFGEPLTWTCHVCGIERPDAFIGVLTRERMSDLGVRFRENVRHCNDRRECAEGAKEVFFVARGSHEEDDFTILNDTPPNEILIASGRDPDNDYEDFVIDQKEHL